MPPARSRWQMQTALPLRQRSGKLVDRITREVRIDKRRLKRGLVDEFLGASDAAHGSDHLASGRDQLGLDIHRHQRFILDDQDPLALEAPSRLRLRRGEIAGNRRIVVEDVFPVGPAAAT